MPPDLKRQREIARGIKFALVWLIRRRCPSVAVHHLEVMHIESHKVNSLSASQSFRTLALLTCTLSSVIMHDVCLCNTSIVILSQSRLVASFLSHKFAHKVNQRAVILQVLKRTSWLHLARAAYQTLGDLCNCILFSVLFKGCVNVRLWHV